MRLISALAAAALIGTSVTAGAVTVFTETFDSGFQGASLAIPAASHFSDRWLNTDYTFINAADGFTFTGPAYLAVNLDNPSDAALLLNEGGSTASVTVTGLTVGKGYSLSFLQWGDNVPGSAYTYNVFVNGGLAFSGAGVDGAPGSLPATRYTTRFTASSTTAVLLFDENSTTVASPIFDDITVATIPEPATWGLLIAGFVMVGASMRRRSRFGLTA